MNFNQILNTYSCFTDIELRMSAALSRVRNMVHGGGGGSNNGGAPIISPNTNDVVKTGCLVKKKTMKKRFFVLRQDEGLSLPARLEYYDSEHKYNERCPPKKQFILKQCFNISAKFDPRGHFVIALHINKDCHSLVAPNESEHSEWLRLLNYHRTTTRDIIPGEEATPCDYYNHVWHVDVQERGLASIYELRGPHFFCLTSRSITLVRRRGNFPSKREITLASVRNIAAVREFFYMEVGRNAVMINGGCLWLKTEDEYIAQNMRSIIRNAMDNYPRSRTQSFNQGSEASTVTHIRPRTNTNPVRDRAASESSPTSFTSDLNSANSRRLHDCLPFIIDAVGAPQDLFTHGSSESNGSSEEDSSYRKRISESASDDADHSEVGSPEVDSPRNSNVPNYLPMKITNCEPSPECIANVHSNPTSPNCTDTNNTYLPMTQSNSFPSPGPTNNMDDHNDDYMPMFPNMTVDDSDYYIMENESNLLNTSYNYEGMLSPSSCSSSMLNNKLSQQQLLNLPSSHNTSTTSNMGSVEHSTTSTSMDDHRPRTYSLVEEHQPRSYSLVDELHPRTSSFLEEHRPRTSSFVDEYHSRTSSLVDEKHLAGADMNATSNTLSSVSISTPTPIPSNQSQVDCLCGLSPGSGNSSITTGTPSSDRYRDMMIDNVDKTNNFFNSYEDEDSSGDHHMERPIRTSSVGSKSDQLRNRKNSAPVLGISAASHSWSGPSGSFFGPAFHGRSKERHSQCQDDRMMLVDLSQNKSCDQLSKEDRKSSSMDRFRISIASRVPWSGSKSSISKRDKKDSEGDSNKGIEIPGRYQDEADYQKVDLNPSPRSNASDSCTTGSTPIGSSGGNSLAPSSARSNYLDMEPKTHLSQCSLSEPYMEMGTSTSKDDYVIMSSGTLSDSPSVDIPSPFYSISNRSRKTSKTFNSLALELGSPSEDCVDGNFELSQSFDVDKSKTDKHCGRNVAKSVDQRRQSNPINTSGKSPSESEVSIEKNKSKGSVALKQIAQVFYPKKASPSNPQKMPVSPQGSPLPKSVHGTPSPYSSLGRRGKGGKDTRETTPCLGAGSIQEATYENDDNKLTENNLMKSLDCCRNVPCYSVTDQSHKGVVDNTRSSKQSTHMLESSKEINYLEIKPNDQTMESVTLINKGKNETTLPDCSISDPSIYKTLSASELVYTDSISGSYINVPIINTLTSPLQGASTAILPLPPENAYVNLTPGDNIGTSTDELAKTKSPIKHITSSNLNNAATKEQRPYMNICPVNMSNQLKVTNTDKKTHCEIETNVKCKISSQSIVPNLPNEICNDYMEMDLSEQIPASNCVNVMKRPQVPAQLLVKADDNFALERLNLSSASMSSNERSRCYSGPGAPEGSTNKTKKNECDSLSSGRAASACSSPISYSPPNSPSFGSVSSMSSLSEGGLSSASSTCTVVNVGLGRSTQKQSQPQPQQPVSLLPLHQEEVQPDQSTKAVVMQPREDALNYASLDLNPRQCGSTGSSPCTSQRDGSTTDVTSEGESLSYTEIDFTKSEGLHTTSLARNSERQ